MLAEREATKASQSHIIHHSPIPVQHHTTERWINSDNDPKNGGNGSHSHVFARARTHTLATYWKIDCMFSKETETGTHRLAKTRPYIARTPFECVSSVPYGCACVWVCGCAGTVWTNIVLSSFYYTTRYSHLLLLYNTNGRQTKH